MLCERPRADPLAWIHRAEARAIAAELGAPLARYGDEVGGALLLRLSDRVMRDAAAALAGRRYFGPGSAALERCYDKHEATRAVAAAGVAVPRTALADAAGAWQAPFVLKPRRGSDSIGVRIVRAVPPRKRSPDYLLQERIVGWELTVAVFRGEVGAPLRILVPPGRPYSFLRKYLLRPARTALEDAALARRARDAASTAARALGADWAARVDLLFDPRRDRLFFLECDAAPLVGAESAWAASFAAAGVGRAAQIGLLLSTPL